VDDTLKNAAVSNSDRRALLGFLAFGLFWGAWGAALPALQRQTQASDGELGFGLVLVGLGALVSMRATGVLIDRLGMRLTPAAIAAFGVAGFLPALVDSPSRLYVVLLAVGATSGAMDVAINADAVQEEVRSGRPLLNLAHATFSAAVVVASLTTGALRSAGAGPVAVFAMTSVVVVATALLVRGVPPAPTRAANVRKARLFQRVPGWLLLVGTLGATAYWIENAWQSWGAVHVERSFDAPPGVSALAPALFAGAMAAGRLGVHRLARPGSERMVLSAGALVAAAGSLVAALAPIAAVALAAIIVAGAGCAVCAPTLVSLAGRAADPHERGTVVGSLTTLMYFGFLVGPAAVGGLAQAASLRASLALVAGLAFLLGMLFVLVPLPGTRR
jgi:MFS family permease